MMSPAPLTIPEFCEALASGSTAKILRAVKEKLPMHPELPKNMGGSFQSRLSPLACVWRWPWGRRPERCFQALQALLAAGADPNLPDPQGRRPLHLLLWLVDDLPPEAAKALLAAGADPCRESLSAPGKNPLTALNLCILHDRVPQAHWILDAETRAARHDTHVTGRMSPLVCLAYNHQTWGEQDGFRLVERLLELGADPDVINAQGRPVQDFSPRVSEWIKHAQACMRKRELNTALPDVARHSGFRL